MSYMRYTTFKPGEKYILRLCSSCVRLIYKVEERDGRVGLTLIEKSRMSFSKGIDWDFVFGTCAVELCTCVKSARVRPAKTAAHSSYHK